MYASACLNNFLSNHSCSRMKNTGILGVNLTNRKCAINVPKGEEANKKLADYCI